MTVHPEVETRPWEEQHALDDPLYRTQLGYLLERSAFYRSKLGAAGISSAEDAGGLDAIGTLPFTEKRELKETTGADNPVGAHLCARPDEIVRIYSTSGTTGTPSFIPLTAEDVESWIVLSMRSYGASGVKRGQRLVSTFNAGPFVAGATLAAFERLGLQHVPVGMGNTERLVTAVTLLGAHAVVLTPSYAAYAAEWADEHGADLAGSKVERLIVAGEPGGGEPALRAKLEEAWGAQVTEAMGIGDVGVSIWGECPARDGMHFSGRGLIHPELIDPATGEALDLTGGATGELVLSHLVHRGAPVLRFRTRDHVEVRAGQCSCGRTAPRIRCIGRTDDMLIVRGVNVFPSAVREIVGAFAPRVTGNIAVRPRDGGVKQEPPLPVAVELARGAAADDALATEIRDRIRTALVVQAAVELVPFGTLVRSDYKSKLVER